MKLHFHDSIRLRLFPAPPDNVDFQGQLFTRSGFELLSVPFSRIDGRCTNCTADDLTINVALPAGALLPGMLECNMVYLVPAKNYPDGFRHVCANTNLPIELVRGQGDFSASLLTVNINQPTSVLPSQCGDDCACSDASQALSFDEIDSIINDDSLDTDVDTDA